MFGSLGAPELIIIGLVLVLLFGVGKISGLGRELGGSIKEFRKAVKDEDEDKDKKTPPAVQAAAPPPVQAAPPPPPAQQYAAPPAAPTQPGEQKNIF